MYYALKVHISFNNKHCRNNKCAPCIRNLSKEVHMRAQFITAQEVAEILGISRSKSYQIIRQMNKELKAQGYITIAGKCPAQYFKQKFYGFQIPGGE